MEWLCVAALVLVAMVSPMAKDRYLRWKDRRVFLSRIRSL